MPIVIVVLVLGAYVYALITLPEFRRPGLVLGVLVAAGLGLYFWLGPEAEVERIRIAPAELTLDQLEFTRSTRGGTLEGRVANGSPEFRLREMTIEVNLFDCPPSAAELSGCATIADASAIARPDAPPGQLRGFSASFVFPNLPPVEGDLRWDYEILETRATE
jgi:hypothetical protein